jgi:hypothetical protein
MATKQLNLPGNLPDVNLNKNQDKLSITFDNACTWCYSDPNFVFGNPSVLPAAGYYPKTTPPTSFNNLQPVADGTVNYNAVTSGECNPEGITETGHTITVTG